VWTSALMLHVLQAAHYALASHMHIQRSGRLSIFNHSDTVPHRKLHSNTCQPHAYSTVRQTVHL